MSVIKGEDTITVSSILFDFEAYGTFIAVRVENQQGKHENICVLFQPAQWRDFLLLVNSLPPTGLILVFLRCFHVTRVT